MKNLTQLKKFLKPGQQWHTYNHWFNSDMGTRKVAVVQSNSFGFYTDRGTISWCNFPKATQLKILDESLPKFQVCEDNEPVLTYTFVS